MGARKKATIAAAIDNIATVSMRFSLSMRLSDDSYRVIKFGVQSPVLFLKNAKISEIMHVHLEYHSKKRVNLKNTWF